MVQPGQWEVRARVERLIEPALLLLLRERALHGYELLERVSELVPDEGAVDLGNLYRLLRSLEDEGIVASEWRADLPGPTKRVYRLTEEGGRLLERWMEALRQTQAVIGAFLRRHDESERR